MNPSPWREGERSQRDASGRDAGADPATRGLDVYAVGGAIRDALLGLPVQDHDYVVVGATPQMMQARGFRPVGRDFPVFLHPRTQAEYALARTERKMAAGYQGFVFNCAPGVTLEDDLRRRDLTINAMARRVAQDGALVGPIIDFCGGQADLASRTFRHVSEAFAEDPVRILRVARFAARLASFEIAPGTCALMREMVAAGEADALTPERVWQELARGLMEAHPVRMLEVLRACGALAILLPELSRLWDAPPRGGSPCAIDTGLRTMRALEAAAAMRAPLTVRFAVLTQDLDRDAASAEALPRRAGHAARGVSEIEALCQRLRVPANCRDLARIVTRERGNLHRSGSFDAIAMVGLLERCDALRKPERFHQALWACEATARARSGSKTRGFAQAARLRRALQAAAIDAGAIAKRHAGDPACIKQAVRAARIEAVAQALDIAPSRHP